MANHNATTSIVADATEAASWTDADLAAISDADLEGMHSTTYFVQLHLPRQVDELRSWRHQMPGNADTLFWRLDRISDDIAAFYAALEGERQRRKGQAQ